LYSRIDRCFLRPVKNIISISHNNFHHARLFIYISHIFYENLSRAPSITDRVPFFYPHVHDKKNEVSVTSRNFEDEIEQQQNLLFTFNKDLYPDSLLYRWDSTQFMSSVRKLGGCLWNNSGAVILTCQV